MEATWIHSLLLPGAITSTKSPSFQRAEFYTPGDLITTDGNLYICGHGTILEKSSNCVFSTVAGNVEYISKLIRVIPPKSRYLGEVGDVIIGRISQVCQRKWLVDINGQQQANLQLSAIYLPGGIQRRRLEEDELQIRQFFVEGDLVSAEVQSVHSDGSVAIHTRSARYGKLCNGIFLSVNPKNIARLKSHFLSFPCGIDMIIGMNGYVWIGLSEDMQVHLNTASSGEENPYLLPNRKLTKSEIMLMSRIRNCVLLLDSNSILISETSIQNCFEISLDFEISQLLTHKVNTQVSSALTNTR